MGLLWVWVEFALRTENKNRNEMAPQYSQTIEFHSHFSPVSVWLAFLLLLNRNKKKKKVSRNVAVKLDKVDWIDPRDWDGDFVKLKCACTITCEIKPWCLTVGEIWSLGVGVGVIDLSGYWKPVLFLCQNKYIFIRMSWFVTINRHQTRALRV